MLRYLIVTIAFTSLPIGAAAMQEPNLDLLIESRTAPIQSLHDLQAHIYSSDESPLNHLPQAARIEFESSLSFSKNGLGSFRYDVLEEILSYSQIYKILSLFGMQEITFSLQNAKAENDLDKVLRAKAEMNHAATDLQRQDHESNTFDSFLGPETNQFSFESGSFLMDFKCAGQGSCVKQTNWACTLNC